ncbi:hypothetical protein Tco_1500900 [Tanacetum coccineum]
MSRNFACLGPAAILRSGHDLSRCVAFTPAPPGKEGHIHSLCCMTGKQSVMESKNAPSYRGSTSFSQKLSLVLVEFQTVISGTERFFVGLVVELARVRCDNLYWLCLSLLEWCVGEAKTLNSARCQGVSRDLLVRPVYHMSNNVNSEESDIRLDENVLKRYPRRRATVVVDASKHERRKEQVRACHVQRYVGNYLRSQSRFTGLSPDTPMENAKRSNYWILSLKQANQKQQRGCDQRFWLLELATTLGTVFSLPLFESSAHNFRNCSSSFLDFIKEVSSIVVECVFFCSFLVATRLHGTLGLILCLSSSYKLVLAILIGCFPTPSLLLAIVCITLSSSETAFSLLSLRDNCLSMNFELVSDQIVFLIVSRSDILHFRRSNEIVPIIKAPHRLESPVLSIGSFMSHDILETVFLNKIFDTTLLIPSFEDLT